MAQDQVGVKLTLDANDGLKSLKDLKNSIKEAKGDLIAMAEKFGETSTEARSAAKRVAELEDAIGDSKSLIDQFNPDKKFNAFAQSLNGVLGGFSALQGAMGLLGVESEDLQKQLLKVQSAMALSQGLNQVLESGNALKNFGKTIIDTLGKGGAIGVAAAGVAFLVAEMSGLFDNKKRADAEAYKNTLTDFSKGASSAIQEVAKMRTVFEEARKGVVKKSDALKQYNEGLGKSLGTTTSLEQAEKNLADKATAYIQMTALKAQANALFAKSAEQMADVMVKQQTVENLKGKSGIVGSLYEKAVKELEKAKSDAKSIENLGANLLTQADQISNKYKIVSAGTGSNTTVKDKKAEAEQMSAYDQMIRRITLDQHEKELQAQRDKHMRSRELITDQNAAIITANVDLHTKLDQLDQARTANENYRSEQRQKMTEQEAQARMQAATAVGNAFGALADLLGKQTAAGKALAIAQATINTWVGVTEVLRAKSVLPEPFGTISKIANVAAIVASGINAIKNISKTQVPGAAGGGSGSMSAPTLNSPLSPQIGVTNTQLNQQQLNQLGNATTRAYVVESDVSGNQERIRRLNRAARLG